MKIHWRQKRQERGPIINAVRTVWRENEQYHRSSNNRRILKGAKQEPYTYKDVLEKYGSICHLCEKPIDLSAPRGTGLDGWEQGLQVDHVIALSRGGDDTLANVRPAHGKCNILKSAKDPHTFIQEIRNSVI
jgi:5-methylcytosine-specific restriction endonuclease McrA